MTFLEFSRQVWGDRWAICRKTPRNLARYGRCITRKEYEAARSAWSALA